MLTSILAASPIIGACLTALIGIGTAWWNVYQSRKAAENSPEMKANTQAKTDLAIEQQAEAAVEASDRGDLSAERIGDAE